MYTDIDNKKVFTEAEYSQLSDFTKEYHNSLYNYPEDNDSLCEVYELFLLEAPEKTLYFGSGPVNKRYLHLLNGNSHVEEINQLPNRTLGIRSLYQSEKEICLYAERRLIEEKPSKYNGKAGDDSNINLDYLDKEFKDHIDEFVSRVLLNEHLTIIPKSFDKADTIFFRLESYPDLELTLFSKLKDSTKLIVRADNPSKNLFVKAYNSNELDLNLLQKDLEKASNLNKLLSKYITNLILRE